MSLDIVFEDDFNDNDYTDKWTLGGQGGVFGEGNGNLTIEVIPGGPDYLDATGITVTAGKVYRIDYEIVHLTTFVDGWASILIGGEHGEAGEIALNGSSVGKYSVNVTAPDSGKIRLAGDGGSGRVSLNYLTVSEEKFFAMST